jgi:uncharacterized membrane protein YczE
MNLIKITTNLKFKNLSKRIIMVCVGVLLLSVAIALSVYAGMGSDPCTCMNLGVSEKFGISFGNWQLILNCSILIFTFLFSRHFIGIGTLINMTAIGYLVDFFRWVFTVTLPVQPSLLLRVFMMALALVVLAFSAALYIYPRLGISPYDSIGYIMAEHFHFQFRWCRIASDMLALLIGWLCGSIVGIGTVLTAFCMGPLIKAFGDLIAKKFPLEFD